MSLFGSCRRILVCSTARLKSAIVFSLMIARLMDCWQVMAVRMSENGMPCRIKARTEGVGKIVLDV
jgi:hypothetical protein